MKEDHKNLTLYSHRQIRKRSVFRKSLLRYLACCIFLNDPYPLLDNSYNFAYLTKRAAEDVLCSALEDNANWVIETLEHLLPEKNPCDRLCPNHLWHKQGICRHFDSHDWYLVYSACLLEKFFSEPFVILRCALHSEIYFRLFLPLSRHFISPTIDQISFSALSKHTTTKKTAKKSFMNPVQSYFEYILSREVSQDACRILVDKSGFVGFG